MGEVPWSKNLKFTREEIFLWAKVESRLKDMPIITRLASRLELRVEVQNSLSYPLLTFKKKIKRLLSNKLQFRKFNILSDISMAKRPSWNKSKRI